MADTIKIGGELESKATGGVVTRAHRIFDEAKGKYQSAVNQETDQALADRYTKEETYSKEQLNNLITTPDQQFVTVEATSQTTSATDVLPATGAADTVYRVGKWDGSQFDASVYSEYAWNGSQYVHLSTKTKIGEVFDISAYHATDGVLAKYADLTAALGTDGENIPDNLRKGGMSVKFIQSSDNKYVQYRLMSDEWSIDVNDWLNESIYDDISNVYGEEVLDLSDFQTINGTYNSSINKWERGLSQYGFYSKVVPVIGGSLCKILPQQGEKTIFGVLKELPVGESMIVLATGQVWEVGITDVKEFIVPSDGKYLIVTYNETEGALYRPLPNVAYAEKDSFNKVNVIFDISEYNASGTPSILAQYATLSSAIAAIPMRKKKGGMTIRYKDSNSSKYVQYRYTGTSTADEDFTNESNWKCYAATDDILIESKLNLKYSDLTTNGYYRTTNGEFNSSPYARSLKFTNNGYKSILLEVAVLSDTNYGIVLYDENDLIIRGYNFTQQSKLLVDCSDAYSIAISVPHADPIIAAFKCNLSDSYIVNTCIDNKEDIEELEKIKEIEAISLPKDIILDTIKLDSSNPPVSPTESGIWDWQIGRLKYDGVIEYDANYRQSKLIKCTPGEKYKYKGYFNNSSGIGFYNSNKQWIRTICSGHINGSETFNCEFIIPKDVYYFSVNCVKTGLSAFSLKRFGSLNDVEHADYKTFGINKNIYEGINSYRFRLSKNFCNSSGTENLFTLNGLTPLKLDIYYNTPQNTDFYQKENWWREENINRVEFPMANMNTYLKLYYPKNNEVLNSFVLSDTPLTYRSLLRQQPPIMIKFNCPEGQESNYTNLRLYITATDGICDTLTIKDGEDTIYTKSFNSSTSVYTLYSSIKEELAQLTDYSFDVIFTDIENLSITDMVVTKTEGLPFITEFSSNCLTTGTMVKDTYPVFIEFQDNRVYNLDIAYCDGKVRLYIDNTYMPVSIDVYAEIYSIEFGENIEVVSSSYQNKKTLNGQSLIHGYTGHALSNAPIGASNLPNLHSPVGSISLLSDLAQNQGFENMSVEEIGLSFIRGDKLPEKVYFVELDDFATLQGFRDMLSNTSEDGMRVLEILKKTGIKMGFAQEFDEDDVLFNKIKDGTATPEEQLKLTTNFTNSQILKMRALMRTLGWTVSIHTFIGGNEAYPTTAKFNAFKEAIRNTIWWYERMYEKTPLIYVTAGTGNSSPYYRRIMPIYGIPIVVQDYTLYSSGSFMPFVARKSMASRETLPDVDYNIYSY